MQKLWWTLTCPGVLSVGSGPWWNSLCNFPECRSKTNCLSFPGILFIHTSHHKTVQKTNNNTSSIIDLMSEQIRPRESRQSPKPQHFNKIMTSSVLPPDATDPLDNQLYQRLTRGRLIRPLLANRIYRVLNKIRHALNYDAFCHIRPLVS